jgi:hypothetical protein
MEQENLSTLIIHELRITSISGEQHDLRGLVIELNIWENILEPFISARLIVIDTLDLQQNLPLIGNELVEMVFDQAGERRVLNFRVYKLGRQSENISNIKQFRALNLYLCSEEKLTNENIKISKKYTGTGDMIVADVVTNALSSTKAFNTVASTGDLEIYSNYWSPEKIIDFTSRLSKTNTFSDYIFWEDTKGFNFYPLSYLMAQEHIHEVTFNKETIEVLADTGVAQTWQMNNFFDILTSMKMGMFGQRDLDLDVGTGVYTNTEISLDEMLESITTLGNNLPYDPELFSADNFHPDVLYDKDISPIRTTSMKMLNNYNMVMKMNGNFIRKPGDILNLKYTVIDNESVVHKSFNGKWLIVAVNNLIDKTGKFEQNLMMVKNAFFRDPRLPLISSLKNI